MYHVAVYKTGRCEFFSETDPSKNVCPDSNVSLDFLLNLTLGSRCVFGRNGVHILTELTVVAAFRFSFLDLLSYFCIAQISEQSRKRWKAGGFTSRPTQRVSPSKLWFLL